MAKLSITNEDAEAFSTKLLAWGLTLDAKERALLHVFIKAAEGNSELSDKELEGVAGGMGATRPDLRIKRILGSFIGGAGGLASGGEVSDGGTPTVSREFGPGMIGRP